MFLKLGSCTDESGFNPPLPLISLHIDLRMLVCERNNFQGDSSNTCKYQLYWIQIKVRYTLKKRKKMGLERQLSN